VIQGDSEGLSNWIRARRPLRETSRGGWRETNTLELAVETGFYSLVKLLLDKAIWSDDELDNSMESALWADGMTWLAFLSRREPRSHE